MTQVMMRMQAVDALSFLATLTAVQPLVKEEHHEK